MLLQACQRCSSIAKISSRTTLQIRHLAQKATYPASAKVLKAVTPKHNAYRSPVIQPVLARSITGSSSLGAQAQYRHQLKDMKKVVVKLGSAVITREDECGLALGRLASIVEQVSELQNGGYQMLIVTSGAVAFGKQKLRQEIMMSMSMRQTLSTRENATLKNKFKYQEGPRPAPVDVRACAASGQSGLMSLYDTLFVQYGVQTSQILVTKPDFYNDHSRQNLKSTLNELLKLNIIPIVNANDAVAPPPEYDVDLAGVISVKDNDSLAARLCVEVNADLLIILSDVDGLYTAPPGTEGSRLLHTYSPTNDEAIVFGSKSRVGMGGMDSKVKAATYAMDHGVSVVIANGFSENTIINVMQGKKTGTFFTNLASSSTPVEVQAIKAREGGRDLQALTPGQRADIINNLANSLLDRQAEILAANKKDLEEARYTGLEAPMIARLVLSPNKLKSLAGGLRQIAAASHENIGRVLRRTQLADGMMLKQVTVPIGVLLVIFESRPDCLPQVAALAIGSGNGLLLKGGKEAGHSNKMLHELVCDALEPYVDKDTVGLISRREDIEDLLHLNEYIDLVIPRGSGELVQTIQQQSKGIPVLGHSEGVCHVYVDKDCDNQMALKIIKDSKCDYPAACNAMETLLIHKGHLKSELFDSIMDMLKAQNVKINAGPRLLSHLKFGPTPARNMSTEYNGLECAVEVVDDVEDAVSHIHKYGSAHTDVIITNNGDSAEKFMSSVDSACVFHNASTRFSDGYRFGLGAEVGISTGRIHSRGPVGVEGLLTTKWILEGSGDTVSEFAEGGEKKYLHQVLPLDAEDGTSGSDSEDELKHVGGQSS